MASSGERLSAKDKRRVQAMKEEMGRVMKRLYSVSLMLMYADAAWSAYYAAMEKVDASGLTDDQLVFGANQQTIRLEHNEFTAASAHLAVCLALLYVVVEGWRKWKLFDDRVDELLRSPFVQTLREYRHTIFHAKEFDHESLIDFRSPPYQIVVWCSSLQNEFRRALRHWHNHLEENMEQYLLRSNL